MNTDVAAQVGALLRRCRQQPRPGRPKGLSLDEVAAITGLSASGLGNIEAGRRQIKRSTAPVRSRPSTLAVIADAVGASPQQLSDAGRPDAAEVLAAMLVERAAERDAEQQLLGYLAKRRRQFPTVGAFLDWVLANTEDEGVGGNV